MMVDDLQIGYCTNVHAGADLQTTKRNLAKYAVAVRDRLGISGRMGVGLWLAADAVRSIKLSGEVAGFRRWLEEHGLLPFTMNGFPYGDFHQAVVKKLVYQPTWMEAERRDYTIDLIDVLDQVLPSKMEGSISTLPVCWGQPSLTDEQRQTAAKILAQVADYLAKLESESGRLIYLCIEPEPGCFMDTSLDIVEFFTEQLDRCGDPERVRRYLRVCHDVCHAAVMFEPQKDVVERFQQHGIRIGKVQVSSAIRLRLDSVDRELRKAALQQLSEFAEDRYLHQSVWRSADTGETTFYEDLGPAMAALESHTSAGELRVHFHVPIFVQKFGFLESTQDQILECFATTSSDRGLTHYEVETYAWGVLPPSLRCDDLAEGIATELDWFRRVASR